MREGAGHLLQSPCGSWKHVQHDILLITASPPIITEIIQDVADVEIK
jgi:hypothetical protein